MTVYTYSQARQQFSHVLDRASREGQVLIQRQDGQVFSLAPVKQKTSPLNVKALKTSITRQDILSAVRESRSR